MEGDLNQVFQLNDTLSFAHRRFFMYQIFRGLKYIHSAGIIHRDIKPHNLLVNSNCDLKICDFGLSTIHKLLNSQNISSINHSDYVTTRWFRAPELLLKYGTSTYDYKIDMWSVGCVFAQMFQNKQPLFGQSTLSKQIRMLVRVLGMPQKSILAMIKDEKTLSFLELCKQTTIRVGLADILKEVTDLELDLLSKLLKFNPEERISAEEALQHPYFVGLHKEDDEPMFSDQKDTSFDFEFENYNLDKEILRDLILDEIILHHSQRAYCYYEAVKEKFPTGILQLLYQEEESNAQKQQIKQNGGNAYEEGMKNAEKVPSTDSENSSISSV